MEHVLSGEIDRCRPGYDRSHSRRQAEPEDSCEYDEEAFHRILGLERKRSERSRRPFLVMLLSLEGIAGDGKGGDIVTRVFSCLAATKRETDVMGWYRQGGVAGVIFTEISGACDRSLSESIVKRTMANLELKLSPEEVEKSHISFCYFPEKNGQQVVSAPLTLYPDIRKRLGAHKKSLFAKRVIDILGALVALALFFPFFLIISAMIKLSTRGPVFFRQERVGQYGKRFVLLKFRSMYVDSDPSLHKEYTKKLILAGRKGSCNGAGQGAGVFKIRNDPRVTPLGRFLRRSSLDEVPQLLNVLAGDMSLVGPRPPIPYELEKYDLWHRRRVLEMKPGITGMWQVEGRSSTTFDEMVRLDLYYMTHWSLWLDLKLIFKTPLAVLSGRGAY
ncbi:MAG: sugar transferase [Syntrophobacteraceae bacterium]